MLSNNSFGSGGRSSPRWRIAAFTAGSARRCASSSRLHSASRPQGRTDGVNAPWRGSRTPPTGRAAIWGYNRRPPYGPPPRYRARQVPAPRRPGSCRTRSGGRSPRRGAASTPNLRRDDVHPQFPRGQTSEHGPAACGHRPAEPEQLRSSAAPEPARRRFPGHRSCVTSRSSSAPASTNSCTTRAIAAMSSGVCGCGPSRRRGPRRAPPRRDRKA